VPLRGPGADAWAGGPRDLALARCLETEAALLSTAAALLTEAGAAALPFEGRMAPLLEVLDLVRARLRAPTAPPLALHGETASLWHWHDDHLYLAVTGRCPRAGTWAEDHGIALEWFPDRPSWLP
jgi:hypothetical protein